ncbi:MAG: hypothetical protein J7530_07970 [Novosphingobium sp.]|nr:hypothetical protein [Novosphingobium sp.]
MNDPGPPPEISGEPPPKKIPGLPATEIAAAVEGISLQKAIAEVDSLSRGETPEQLQRDAERKEHTRNQRFRDHFERIAICSLWVAALAIAAVGGIWLWHMAMPESARWLKKDDVSHLQSIMTAGLLVGVIGQHFKKRMS